MTLKKNLLPSRHTLIFLLPLLAVNTSHADMPAVMEIEEVIITVAKSQNSAFELPYSALKLDQQELDKRAPRSMPEALLNVPGVLVQKTANGHGSPFIRGFTGYRTLATIDGIRYNNSVYRDGANEYFSLIDNNSLSSIELLSGPSSTLYGSDAIGGTLNLQSKPALRKNSPLAEAEGYIDFSQDYRYASAENSQISRTEAAFGKTGDWGVLAGVSLKDFDDVEVAEFGKQKNTGYQEQAFDIRFDKALNEKWTLNALHQSLKQDDVWRTHSTIYGQPFAGTTIGTDLLRLKDQARKLSYVKLKGLALNGLADELLLTLSQQNWNEDGYRIKSDGSYLIDYFDSSMHGIDLQLNTFTQQISWTYGVDYYQDNVDSGRTDFNADGSVDQVRIQGPVGDDARYEQLGAYLQAEVAVSDRFNLNLGSRYTSVWADIGRFEDPANGEAAAYDEQWEQIVSSIRLNYAFDSKLDWRIWGGLSQSFRAPNIADLSRYGKSRSNELEIAATNLNAEEFLTYELGLKAQKPGYQLSASYYYTEIDRFITSVPTGRIIDGQTEVTKQNSSDGYIQGVELNLEKQLSQDWQVFANTTWLEGRLDVFQSEGSYATEAYSRIMPLTSTIGLNWENLSGDQWLRFSLTRAQQADKLSSGDQQDTQRIPVNGTPAHTLLNIHGGWDINSHLSLSVGLENLLDEAYRNHGSGVNGPGRGLMVALQTNF